ncbi:YgaP-like transmembrane domain [Candidatus Omnitrophota bacterium]
MSLEHTIRLFAGTLVLTGIALGFTIHHGWYFLATFVSLNLIQSSFTKWCLAESLLKKYVFVAQSTTKTETGDYS